MPAHLITPLLYNRPDLVRVREMPSPVPGNTYKAARAALGQPVPEMRLDTTDLILQEYRKQLLVTTRDGYWVPTMVYECPSAGCAADPIGNMTWPDPGMRMLTASASHEHLFFGNYDPQERPVGSVFLFEAAIAAAAALLLARRAAAWIQARREQEQAEYIAATFPEVECHGCGGAIEVGKPWCSWCGGHR